MSAHDPDLQAMLRSLGQATMSPHSHAEEQAREKRMAALIDDQVAELGAARRASHSLGFTLMAAAVVVLSLGGLHYLRWDTGTLTIEQEPLAIGKDPKAARPPSAAPPDAPAVRAPRVVAPTARAGAASAPEVAPSAAPSAAPAEPKSTLGQENQLFKEAVEVSRTGDVEGALTRLDRLLVDNPASPLAQQARVLKFRLLAAQGRTEEARREAERYLATYPTGFAVSEAKAVKAGAGGSGGAKPEEPPSKGPQQP